jgi:hypothetical protein
MNDGPKAVSFTQVGQICSDGVGQYYSGGDKDGHMVLRWVASALADAATRMRKLRGCGQMKTLLKALDSKVAELDERAVRKAA